MIRRCASLALLVVGSFGCVAPPSEGDADTTEAASTGALRVVFHEYPSQSFQGGDVGWFDAGRGEVVALSHNQPWGEPDAAYWLLRAFDPESGEWLERSRTPVRPGDPSGTAANDDHAYAVDASAGRVLRVSSTGEIYTYANESWSKLSGSGFPARRRFSVAYDADRDRLVVFGGTGTSETWEWTRASGWNLALAQGPTTNATPRSIAYDPVRKQTVLAVAGEGTWAWNGASWSQASTKAPAGIAWAPIALSWNPRRNVLTSTIGETMAEWNGTSWRELPFREFGFRQHGINVNVSVWDPKRERLVETGLASGTRVTLDYRVTNLTNVAPEVQKVPPQIAYPGDAFSLGRIGRDADGELERLTYAYSSVPNGARTTSDGAFVWTPSFDDIGKHAFGVTVSDGEKSARGSFEVEVREPASATLLPKGGVSNLGAEVAILVSEDEQRATGSMGTHPTLASVVVRCTYEGDNPAALSIRCSVKGRTRLGNAPGSFGFETSARVKGDGSAWLSSAPSDPASFNATLRAGANGKPELAISLFRCRRGARFGMLGTEGWVVLTQTAPVDAAPIGPLD